MVFLQAGISMATTAVYSLHKTSTRQVSDEIIQIHILTVTLKRWLDWERRGLRFLSSSCALDKMLN